ncbi:cholinesterase-like [Python bivittatus]|uniref:Carboxylic ester hydrolase n=1 Tax=Python bivittatus TaxID=176946 RepID=A0A9F2WIT6_PYTBI|nr:cholinesterase-like [Python bivittatus]
MLHFSCSCLGLFFFFSLICKCSSENDTPVVTSSGPIKGKKVFTGSGPVTAYLGIPYAEPPVKKLRFQKPVPHQPWSEVLETTSFRNSCPQTYVSGLPDKDIWVANTLLSEDCLFLNIWVPHPQPTTPVPVLVWFQGMGFITGTASLDIYNGAIFSATENIIVASMNYRLGALGFLYLPPYAPGNMGLWDQHLALKWLKENIDVFGGDPAQLTLVGQSAGAALVGCHLLSPLSQPLFARAVLQSGVPNAIWPWKSPQEARVDAIMVSKEVGCAKDNHSEVVSCLEKIDIGHENFLPLTMINSLTTDGDFLPDELPKLLETAILQGKPILTGITDDEGSSFTLLMYSSTKTNGGILTWEQLLQGVMGTMQRGTKKDVAESVALKFSEASHGPERYRLAFSQYFRDYFFVCPLAELAAKIRKAGKPVYVYSFSHHSSDSVWPEWVGTPHGAEIPYVFGTMASALQTNRSITEAEEALSRQMMRFWAQFARTGNPTRSNSDEVQWPVYDAIEQNFFHISTGAPQLKQLSPTPLCDFLATLPVNATQSKQSPENMDS